MHINNDGIFFEAVGKARKMHLIALAQILNVIVVQMFGHEMPHADFVRVDFKVEIVHIAQIVLNGMRQVGKGPFYF